MIAALIVWTIIVPVTATALDVERLSPPKSTAGGELVTHVFSIRNTDPAPVRVEISVELPVGWRAFDVPSLLQIGAQEESFLFVTLSVPTAALASDYEPVLSVGLEGSDRESDRLRITAPIRVLPATGLLLESADVASLPGNTASTEIEVTNLGNVQEQVELVISPPIGIHVEWSPTVVALSPRESLPVEVTVRVDASASPGRFLLPVVARSTIYEGDVTQGFVEVNVLPPDPSRVPSTIASVFPIEVVIESTQAFPPLLTSPMPQTSLSIRGDKSVGDSELAFRLRLESLFGPQPLSVSSLLIAYETPSISMRLGDFSTSLTSLLSATITGARLSISVPLLDAVAIIGGDPTTATAGGTVIFGPEALRAAAAYLERRTAISQASSMALSFHGSCFDPGRGIGLSTADRAPVAEWSFEVEGALGQEDGERSWSGLGRVRCDVEPSFVAFDVFRVGGAFPFGLDDRAGYGLSQRYRSETLSLGTSFSHERSNVEGDPAQVTVASDRLGLTLDLAFSDTLPTITAIADLERQQVIETAEDSIRSSYAITVGQTDTLFPFRSLVQVTDRWDRAFDHRLREWKMVHELGTAFDNWMLTLVAEFETILNPRSGERLDGTSHLSLLVESLDSAVGGTLFGTASEDDRDLTLSIHYAPDEAFDIAVDIGISWDRKDRFAPTLSFGLNIATSFDLPLPIAPESGQIEGRVFIDYNENGIFDFALEGGDRPLESVIVSLLDEQQRVSSDSAGLFRFAPLPARRYLVTIAETPEEGILEAPIEVDLIAGDHSFVNLPLRPSLRIAGAVFEVANESIDANAVPTAEQGGDRLATEAAAQSGIQGVRITLSSNEETLLETVTSASGRYEFVALEPGTYSVTVDHATLPERFEFATPDSFAVILQREASSSVDFAGFIRPRQLVITFQPPFADFTSSPDPIAAASDVLLDGGWSFDFDGEIVVYEWDLDGDGATDMFGETIETQFAAPGEYPITLTVTDNDGASDSVTVTLTVQ